MATRKEQAALTRKSIIQAAENLIKEKGHDSVRISDIAKTCSMSLGNFYHYFKSLDELFEEIDSVKFYESFSSLLPNNNGPVLSRLESYLHDWIDLTLNTYGHDYMYHWTRRYTQNTPAYENRIKLVSGHISQILNDGIKNEELMKEIPIEQISYTIAFSIFGFSSYFGLSEGNGFIDQWKEYFCGTFIQSTLAAYFKHP